MSTFFEGVESISLPCTLIILLPLVALVLTSLRSRVRMVGAAVVGTSTMMWARAGRVWDIESTGIVIFAIAAAILGAFALAASSRNGGAWRAPVAGLLTGAIAGWLWQPCVGTEFGEILNNAESDRVSTLALMHVYVAGALTPAVLLAVVPHAFPRATEWLHHTRLRQAGLGLGALHAVTVAIGVYDDLVAELFRASSR